MKRIGMCCACGDYCHKSKTILYQGDEYCRDCAEMMGIDACPDEDLSDDLPDTASDQGDGGQRQDSRN